MTQEPTSSKQTEIKDGEDDILVVFSDLDGTLIHYPDKIPKGNHLLKLPASSTGMRGVISSKTLSLVQQIRAKGTRFVLVSGMRTTTFLSRVKYLPRADAYCTEAGGRIFYATDDISSKEAFVVTPERYDGAEEKDLEAFGLVEDLGWRSEMEKVTGTFMSADLNDLSSNPSKVVNLNERDGLLWDFARDLVSKGYVLDLKGYSACFRVNKKQQNTVSDDDFQALSDGRMKPWSELATSVNLSCVDYYPATSGKKNCCQYLAEKFCPKANPDELLSTNTVCVCDDDNDLEMALACQHAYIPGVSSESMAEAIRNQPDHFSETSGNPGGHGGPTGSETALTLILGRLRDDASA